MPASTHRAAQALSTIYDRARYLLRYRRNPAFYVAVGLVVVLTGWRLASGVPPEEILTEHYIEAMLILAGGIITRLQVWSPQSVEDLVAQHEVITTGDLVEFDPHLAEDPPDDAAAGPDREG